MPASGVFRISFIVFSEKIKIHKYVPRCILKSVNKFFFKSYFSQDIFQDPVSIEDVPDYFEHVKVPMDISSMRKKLEGFHYLTMDDLEADFEQVSSLIQFDLSFTLFFILL